MNYYRRNLGDYARDTQHLTVAEHGIFNLLLDHLYATEKPISSREMAYRICKIPNKKNADLFEEILPKNGAVSEKEVDYVLDQYFIETKKGFTNKRFQKEVKFIESRVKAAKKNGEKGGRPPKNEAQNEKPSGFPEKTQRVSPGLAKKSYSKTPILQDSNTPEKPSPNITPRAAEVISINTPETAAAFLAIGFSEPFGQKPFQEVWLKRFKAKGDTWLTQVMEATIQECQSRQIGIPPQFYSAKRDVEHDETIRFNNLHRRVPL